jgi:hypothetical protein
MPLAPELLAQLQASEADKFVAHLYQARKQYRLVCERPNKGNKAIDREVISSLQVAQSLGFKRWYARATVRQSLAWIALPTSPGRAMSGRKLVDKCPSCRSKSVPL